mmetsp:Transcript_564/g.948  ORF Transcript_564/g.948 Transcript_564/m.948 type:complete len:427 (+) Transcript_564:165-1445(+)|eukprot:CAMPEP_0184292840 /NCGR_PEP_ID=MMETSP1049-20130417/4520_1 /TAXON_ID=77928 /ORGANISM="Proteomonas sulcata, Strain CCMP704" /LENGTH=426 /DNA_ID=CAMNT_0026600747 /DNA_START=274 /DNA_END=1554 /DNA_ORIENTATION=-
MFLPIDLSGALHLPHAPTHDLSSIQVHHTAYPTGTGEPPLHPGAHVVSGGDGTESLHTYYPPDGTSGAYPTGTGVPPLHPGVHIVQGPEGTESLHSYHLPDGGSSGAYPTGTGVPPLHPGATAYPTGTGVPPLHPGAAAYPTGTGVPPLHPGVTAYPTGTGVPPLHPGITGGETSHLAQIPTGTGFPPQTPGITGAETHHLAQIPTGTGFPPQTPGITGAETSHLAQIPTGCGYPPQTPGVFCAETHLAQIPTGCGYPPQTPGIVHAPTLHAEVAPVLVQTNMLDEVSQPHKPPVLTNLPAEEEEASLTGQSLIGSEVELLDSVLISPELYLKAQASRKVNPGIGHASMIGSSMVYGAISATVSDKPENWGKTFQAESYKACGTMTPLGAHIMKDYIFTEVEGQKEWDDDSFRHVMRKNPTAVVTL